MVQQRKTCLLCVEEKVVVEFVWNIADICPHLTNVTKLQEQLLLIHRQLLFKKRSPNFYLRKYIFQIKLCHKAICTFPSTYGKIFLSIYMRIIYHDTLILIYSELLYWYTLLGWVYPANWQKKFILKVSKGTKNWLFFGAFQTKMDKIWTFLSGSQTWDQIICLLSFFW